MMPTSPDAANSWISIVRDVGFPIFVCIYILTRYEKRMQAQTDAINKMIGIILSVYGKKGE